MILVDTSVWIAHLRANSPTLVRLLDARQILAHPFVIGELALGSLKKRDLILGDLQNLPQAKFASDSEVLHFINLNALAGQGIGYIDAHLLASARLTEGATVWTLDQRLSRSARRLGLAMNLPR